MDFNYLLNYDSIVDFIGGMDYEGEWGEGALDTPGPLNGTSEAVISPLLRTCSKYFCDFFLTLWDRGSFKHDFATVLVHLCMP
jgi:hypothetical protein